MAIDEKPSVADTNVYLFAGASDIHVTLEICVQQNSVWFFLGTFCVHNN